MKRIRIMGLCALAVFAVGAMAAASASATPVLLHSYKECVKAAKVGKTYLGHYTSKECAASSRVETGGKRELLSPAGKKFTLQTPAGEKVTLYSYIPASESEPWRGGTVVGSLVCLKAKGSGEYVSEMLSVSTIEFTGCTSGGKMCASPGAKVGRLVTPELSTEPVLGAGEVLLLTYTVSGGPVNMGDLLKDTPNSQIFTVFGTPRTELRPTKDGMFEVEMQGVDVYNPVDNTILPTNADKVAAWFLDTDYDGRTFCITQAFFPDKSAWEKLARALKGTVDDGRFEALSGKVSLPFSIGKHKRAAVKVIDPRGNEVMRVHRMDGEKTY